MAARILIVDDDQDILHLIGMRLEANGYEVIAAASGEEALNSFRSTRPQLVITDLRMGDMDGMTLFAHLHAEAPLVPVIILTAHGTIPEAVAATQQGVFSFLLKPFDSQELLRRVADALRLSPVLDLADEGAQWRRDFLSADLRMEEVLRLARRCAEEKRTTLILGPQGAGKRSLAQAIHRAGELADGPFIDVSCSDLSGDDAERLFMLGQPDSLPERARHGVLYLRDLGDLPLPAQSRLFTFLFSQMQARDPLQRLHSNTHLTKLPEVQVIASSTRSLDNVVTEGTFRSDLYYLLGGCTLQLPALGDRRDDVPLLARHFLRAIDARRNLTADALAVLQEARWPGNVRQLKTVLTQAVAQSTGTTIGEAVVRRIIRDCDEAALIAFDDAKREFERDYLIRLLQATSGNVSHAARVAQRNRTDFYKLLARHGLDPVSFKGRAR